MNCITNIKLVIFRLNQSTQHNLKPKSNNKFHNYYTKKIKNLILKYLQRKFKHLISFLKSKTQTTPNDQIINSPNDRIIM